MPRKNRRNKAEYVQRLGFNPNKYIRPTHHGRATCPRRGDIWFAELGTEDGTSVQAGCRPVLVVSNDAGNYYGDTVVVIPLTTRIKRTDLPTHIVILPADLSDTDSKQQFEPSMLLAEQITTISKKALRGYVGHIRPGNRMTEINDAVSAELGITG